jgi:arylsulfatase A-like enzyme
MKVAVAAGSSVTLVSLAELTAHHAVGKAPDLLPVLGATAVLALAVALVAMLVGRFAPAWLAIAAGVALPLLVVADSLAIRFGVESPSLVASVAGVGGALLVGVVGSNGVGAAVLAGGAVLAYAAGAAVSLDATQLPTPTPRDTPDIVLLVLDTTRRDRLSLYGHTRETTPSLDRLSREARVFDDAWASAPWTSPSHASIFTGLLPAEHGADGQDAVPLPGGLETLSTVLQQAGYQTAGFAANPNLHASGWSEGFDVFEPPWLRGDHSLVPLLNAALRGAIDPWLQLDTTTRVLRAARRWWAANEGGSRYLFLNVLDPHNPYWAPDEDRARFVGEEGCEGARAIMADDRVFYRERAMVDEDLECLGALYDAELFSMDRSLGRFFDWLAERGELDQTLIAVTSDHGERLGERGLLGHLLAMDQHLLRVPLFVRYPAALKPGRVTERVQLVGLPGFLLEIAGVAAPEPMASRSLARHAGEPAVAQHRNFGWYIDRIRRSDPAFDPAPYRGDWVFVADDHHALFFSTAQGPEAARLIDYREDPDLERDLADQLPGIAARLRAIAEALPRFGEPPVPAAAPFDPELRRRLEALGYTNDGLDSE